MNSLIGHFSDLDDPRCPGKTLYPLTDLLVIAVCAVIAGAESYEDIAIYGRSKRHWLAQFLNLTHGIPSHDTFRRVFMLIDPEAFEACFASWATSRAEPVKDEVVAIDGKTIRRSFDRRRDQSPLHVVSAWATDQSLVLAQEAVDADSNEITAIPDVLNALVLEDALVTIDAMGCQKDIAQDILDQDADYLLVLKANHEAAYEAAEAHFEYYCFGRGALGRGLRSRLISDGFDETHGRLVRRRVFACSEAAELEELSEWPGLKTVLATENIRSIKGRRGVTAQIRYFLSSRPASDEGLAEAIRRHWTIENGLHWVLDVTFDEDQSRVRDRTAAGNWALMRKIALNLLHGDSGGKTSIRGRRKKAGWDDEYMERLLTGDFMR